MKEKTALPIMLGPLNKMCSLYHVNNKQSKRLGVSHKNSG